MPRGAALALAALAAFGCSAAPTAKAPSVATRPAPERRPPTRQSGAVRAKPAEKPELPLVPACPDEMALVRRAQGPYCIDRWEASLVRIAKDGSETPYPANQTIDGIESQVRAVSVQGRTPQGYISGEQAERVCRRSHKRLCEVDEWVLACRGPALTRYPYGDKRRANVCNDRFKVLDHHPVPILWKKLAAPGTDPKLMWQPSFMNDPRLFELPHTVLPTGSREGCKSDYGLFDMVGNLHEWVDDPDGTFFGGFFMDTFQNGEGCEYRTLGHGFEYHDYSTGFRCCADPAYRSGSS